MTNQIEKQDRASVRVGWVGRPELGTLECEVIERGLESTASKVQWCNGDYMPVTYSHSRGCYVFSKEN